MQTGSAIFSRSWPNSACKRSVNYLHHWRFSYKRSFPNFLENYWSLSRILKNGDHEEASSYRPISLLPILSEVCERVVLNQLTPYLTSNQRISVKQSGNKRWHSTGTSQISTTDFILCAIDQKKSRIFWYKQSFWPYKPCNSLKKLVYQFLHSNGSNAIFLRDTKQSVSTLFYLIHYQWSVVYRRETFLEHYYSVFM